ncbi:MAG: peptidoglycan DD-metalloendopeptidase family protein [Lentisphaeraceae bacterium]|nr:peptidoglycan DD-metalloendopeptidase family protein [Lentisphaeraceae bacterium]
MHTKFFKQFRCIFLGLIFIGPFLFSQTSISIRTDQLAESKNELDRIFAALLNPKKKKLAIQFIKSRAKEWLPQFKKHLKSQDKTRITMSLYALQYCWGEDLESSILKHLIGRDATDRTLAWNALAKNLSEKELVKVIAPVIDKVDLQVCDIILSFLEFKKPDFERISKIMKNPRLRLSAGIFLPRYYSSSLTKDTRRLLAVGKEKEIIYALRSLISQSHDNEKVKAYTLKLLKHKSPDVRDIAAEYLRYFASKNDRQTISEYLTKETDIYVKSGLEEAMKAIDNREKLFKEGEFKKVELSNDPESSYTSLLKTLEENPTKMQRSYTLSLLPKVQPFEPRYTYTGEPLTSEQRLSQLRLKLVRKLAGYPVELETKVTSKRTVAHTVVAPVRNYIDKERDSYGRFIDPKKYKDNPFENSHHVGDDVAWTKSFEPVVAMAGGVVKMVMYGGESWGGIIILEHKNPKGEYFCSLYAHLGPLVTVEEGDVVKVGQKLASLGRDYTWESGGYMSHLHFGIHKGPFGIGHWITGYMSKENFGSKKHGWVDPQEFIPSYGKD